LSGRPIFFANMSVLYRKYRPQTFAEVIGQNHIKVTLQHEIERSEIGQAYLFCGPRGLGKTTLARLLAKAINCESRPADQSEPCNQCSSCRAIIAGSAIDIIEIDAASHTGVDNVRENIIENSRFTPNQSKYKVFIIDEVHMLSISAFNALLKTLEEPPAHVVFILCTTEIHKIPQTIISRCQRFDFHKVTAEELKKKLRQIVAQEGKRVAEEVLTNIVIHSEGCVRDAESLLGKILILGDDIGIAEAEIVLPRSDFDSIIKLLNFLLDKNATAGIELINNLANNGMDLFVFVDNLLEFLRKVMLIRVSGALGDFGLELDETTAREAQKLSQRFDDTVLMAMIDLFNLKKQEIKTSFIPQFPLELAIVQLCQETVQQSDNDEGGGGSGGGDQSVKEKIKEKISYLSPRKDKKDLPLANTELKKEKKCQPEVEVNFISDEDKLKPHSAISFKKVKHCWPEIADKLLEENYTLSALLKISQPLKCRDNMLEIGVQSVFYKDRLEEMKNRRVVEKVISEVIKAEVIVCGVVKDDLNPVETANQAPVIIESGSIVNNAGQIEIGPSTGTQPESNLVNLNKPKDAAQEVASMF